MQAHKASYLWHGLPRPYRDARVVLLPKGEARSARTALLLRSAGLTDLGVHLVQIAAEVPDRTGAPVPSNSII